MEIKERKINSSLVEKFWKVLIFAKYRRKVFRINKIRKYSCSETMLRIRRWCKVAIIPVAITRIVKQAQNRPRGRVTRIN